MCACDCDLRRGLSALEMDRRLTLANRTSDIGARALSFYLVDMADRGAHQELGFHSIILYAETRFGMQAFGFFGQTANKLHIRESVLQEPYEFRITLDAQIGLVVWEHLAKFFGQRAGARAKLQYRFTVIQVQIFDHHSGKDG